MLKKVEENSFGIIPLQQEDGIWRVLLILHRKGRHWAFPKGHGNPGETPLESAKRELKEETGLEIDRFLQENPLCERYQFHRRREIVVKNVQYFPAVVRGTLSLQEEEIRDAKWVPLIEAAQHLTFKEAKDMCAKLKKLLT